MGLYHDDSLFDEPEKKQQKSSETEKDNWWRQFEDSSVDNYYADIDKFSYKTAFDDSSESWYRRSSFKYKRYTDYSPSSLFRSSIGFRTTYSTTSYGENDAKNKAIRALRTLTRNANTVVNAAKKISYAVQFSNGANSNGVVTELDNNKNQIIYVSPDALLATKTPEEEDAIIDALTGFTLLRVQISQSVAPEVIAQINASSGRALPKRLAEKIYAAKSSMPITAAALAAEFMDSYLAGILAKSMLTRLCRRAVVTDWGGFAPYFTRHAKQFSAASEKITAEAPSVENYVAKISYNMIADETEITIEPAVVAIVDKHLGSELAHADILPACVKVVADLRQYMTTTADTPASENENQLAAAVAEIMAAQESAEETDNKEKETRSLLQQLANTMDNIEAQKQSYSASAKFADAVSAELSAIVDKLHQLKYVESLLTTLTHSATGYKKLIEDAKKYKTAPNLMWSDSHLTDTLAHHAVQLAFLKNAGVDVSPPKISEHKDKSAEERCHAIHENLSNFIQASKEKLKEIITEIRGKIKNDVRAAVQNTVDNSWLKDLPEMTEATKQLQKDLAEKTPKNTLLQKPLDVVTNLRAAFEDKTVELHEIARILDRATSSRSTTHSLKAGLTDLIEKLSPSSLLTVRLLQHAVREASNSSEAMRKFNATAEDWYSERENEISEGVASEMLPINKWQEDAINAFITSGGLTSSSFQAIAMKHANIDIFDMLEEQFGKNEKSIPGNARELSHQSDAIKQQFNNIAASLGMSVSGALAAIQETEIIEKDGSIDFTNPKKIGEIVRELFLKKDAENTTVDENLFGQIVPCASKLLDLRAVTQVNDEARNAVEEEYVAYITDNEHESKPKTRVIPTSKTHYARRILRETINSNKGAIERIKNALYFQGTKRTGEVYGLVSGDLDDGSLHKLRYDCEHIWSQKQIIRLPDVAVGILVDQSGSMSGWKISQAREMCIILAEAVRKIEGMHLHVYGHSANMQSNLDLTMFEHYSSFGAADTANLENLGAIDAYSNNYDGYAIKEAAKMLDKDPAKKKYLFVIADGLPHGRGYCGSDARKHVTSVCSFVRNRLKIPTYAFAVGVPNSERAHFEEQYGKNKVMFLSTVKKCLPQIVRFLHTSIQKEKNLVTADFD